MLLLGSVFVIAAIFTYQKEYEKTQLRLDESAQTYISLTSFYLDDMDRMVVELLKELPNLNRSERVEQTEALIRHRKSSNPQIMDILFLNSQGDILVWSGDEAQPVVNHRSYFEIHQKIGENSRLLTSPELSIVYEDQWFFSLSRSVFDDAAELQGVVVVILHIDTLAELFSSIEDNLYMAVGLVNQNGHLLFRYPVVDKTTGFFMRMPKEITLPISGKEQLRSVSPLDGKVRLITARPLQDYPLFVITSAEVNEVMATWRATQWWFFAFWLVLSATSLLLVWLFFKDRDTQKHQLDLFSRTLSGFFYQLDRTPDGTFHYRYAGHHIHDMFGISSEDAISDSSLLLSRIHPDDIDRVMEESMHSAENLSPWIGIYRVRMANGEYGWVESRDIPEILSDGTVRWTGYANNVTNRKLLESSLKEKEERFKLIVENANDIIFTLDLQGHFTYISPNWKTLLRHDAEEVLGFSMAKFIHPDDLANCLDFLNKVIDTGQRLLGIEYRVQDKLGQWHWHMSNGGPLFNSDGVITEFIGIARDITEKKQLEKKLQQMAMHDPLTGLPNRSFFYEMAANTLEIAYRNNRHFALVFIDLDNFKPVNDQFGHAIGDELLKEVARRMRVNLRASDISGRIGGDEFVVLLSEVADLRAAEFVANKLLLELAKPYEIEGHKHSVTASIGIALYPDHGSTLNQISVNADQAMYHAKHLGRNRVVHYESFLMGSNTSE